MLALAAVANRDVWNSRHESQQLGYCRCGWTPKVPAVCNEMFRRETELGKWHLRRVLIAYSRKATCAIYVQLQMPSYFLSLIS
jgi:hypothetical protein